jgi:hypothetical protein
LTRRNVNRFLVAWLCVTWGAALLRLDYFPLTWAPMYSAWQPEEVTSNRVVEDAVYMRGLLVTRRDGSTGHLGARELNIVRNHMYRLYYQRAFGQPPVTWRHAVASLSPFNRWLRGLEPGEEGPPDDTEFRVFRSLNRTFGLEPDDPGFVVRVQAAYDILYRRFDDVSKVWRDHAEADLRWDERWRERW